MTPGDALAEAKRVATYGQVYFARRNYEHASGRAAERNATVEDIRSALKSATVAIDQTAHWRFEGGTDIDGDELTVCGRFIQPGILLFTVI